MVSHSYFCKLLDPGRGQWSEINTFTINCDNLLNTNLGTPYFGFFSFISVVSGSVDYMINSQPHIIETGDILALSPRQLTEVAHVSEDFRAIYITVDIDLLEKLLTDNPSCKVIADWFITNMVPILKAANCDTGTIIKELQLLTDIDQSHLSNKEEIKTHLMQATAMNISDLLSQHNNHGTASHQETIYRNFIAMVAKHYHNEHSTRFYANGLGITPVYLARIVRRFALKTVKEFIHGLLLRDAIDLLKYSDAQVSEIAYTLGFPDIETFSKFFKNKCGHSPSQIRKNGFKQAGLHRN